MAVFAGFTNVPLFKKQLNVFSVAVALEVSDFVEQLALAVFSKLVVLTPVDTGRARASWNIANTRPDTSVAPDRKERSTASGRAAEGKGRTPALSGGDVSKAAAFRHSSPTADVWITNNLPYIKELNDGKSRQAPKGMIEPMLAQVRFAKLAKAASRRR